MLVTDAQSAIERFAGLLAEARLATGGVERSVIETEVAPVIPLLTELSFEVRAGGNFEAFELRECFTVLTLLGRRLALLDLTPSAAVAIVDLALSATSTGDERRTAAFRQRARSAVVEGFVMGREERVVESAAARASKPVRPLRIDESTFALVVSGVHDATSLGELVDALGRAMLDADASIAIVDLTQLGEPNRDRARAVFAAEEIARMLGAICIFSGVDPRWRAAAADARIHLEELNVEPTFAHALASAKTFHERVQSESNPKWKALLDRLRR